MARSNLAYKQEALEQGFDAQPVPLPRPRLRTIEGQGRGSATQAQIAPWVRTLLVMSITILVVVATTSVARVSIANATVQMMQTTEQTQLAIDQARATGLELEVLHSVVNNPTRIQDTAAALGILPANQPETIQALQGFTPATIELMRVAREEAQAAELAQLAAATPAAYGAIKAAVSVASQASPVVDEATSLAADTSTNTADSTISSDEGATVPNAQVELE